MGYSSIIYTYTRGPSIPLVISTCSLSRLWSLICSRSRFSTSLDIMHRTHAIINFQGANAFNIIVFSSFDLDTDCIIKYHRCFPLWFTMAPFIPSYFICSSCWSSTCFAHPLSLVGHRSIQHSSMTWIFVFPFLLFIIFRHGVVRKATKKCEFIYVGTWEGIGRHYKRNKQLEHMHWLFKDLQQWHQILFHLH